MPNATRTPVVTEPESARGAAPVGLPEDPEPVRDAEPEAFDPVTLKNRQ
jgi:hypothetical protein